MLVNTTITARGLLSAGSAKRLADEMTSRARAKELEGLGDFMAFFRDGDRKHRDLSKDIYIYIYINIYICIHICLYVYTLT